MKNYRVEVSESLEERLAELCYENANLRNRIARAQHRIETLLEIRPESAGIYFSEGLYRIDDYPLRVHYTIHSILSEVEITEIDLWLS